MPCRTPFDIVKKQKPHAPPPPYLVYIIVDVENEMITQYSY